MALAERQAAHRQAEERGQRQTDGRMRAGGLVCAFLSVLSIVGLAAYGFQLNQAAACATMVGAVVASLVAAFLGGTWSQRKARE